MIESLSIISGHRSGICARELTLQDTPNLTHSSLVNLTINQPASVTHTEQSFFQKCDFFES